MITEHDIKFGDERTKIESYIKEVKEFIDSYDDLRCCRECLVKAACSKPETCQILKEDFLDMVKVILNAVDPIICDDTIPIAMYGKTWRQINHEQDPNDPLYWEVI